MFEICKDIKNEDLEMRQVFAKVMDDLASKDERVISSTSFPFTSWENHPKSSNFFLKSPTSQISFVYPSNCFKF